MKTAIQRHARVKKGTAVSLTVEKGRMVVAPLRDQEMSLKTLLAKVTPENLHPETEWGPAVGKEIG